MADFNRQARKSKILAGLTILLFLNTCWFYSCGKSNNEGKATKFRNENPTGETGNPSGNESDQGAELALRSGGHNPAPSQEELNRTADQLDRYFQALEQAVQEIRDDAYDPQALMDKIGKNPAALYSWVRDNTCLVPYQGVLRGPIGVLMDRLGNSLDRALLLHELLRLAGSEVRLARGQLSDGQVREILAKSRGISRTDLSTSEESQSHEVDGLIEEYSRNYQLDPAEVKKTIGQMNKESELFSKEISSRVTEQAAFISSAVQKYRKSDKADPMKAERDSLKDHWWVQVLKEDHWVDLDPTLKDAEQGQSLAAVENTYQPADLGAELFHRINLRVIIERLTPGRVEEKTVLEYPLKASELLGQRIVLSHVPMNWPQGADLPEDADLSDQLKTTVLKEKEWCPVLMAGSEKIVQASFTDSGEVNKNPGKQGGAGAVSGITGGILGALGGEETEKAKEAENERSFLTAEWMEYEFLCPGNQDQRIRRQIFDLLGPAARKENRTNVSGLNDEQRVKRGLALLGKTETLVQVCQFPAEFILHSLMKDLLANRSVLLDLIRQGGSLTNETFREALKNIMPLPGPEYGLAAGRYNWSKFRNAFFLDRPNVLNYYRGLDEKREGQISGRTGLDIVSNEIATTLSPEVDPFSLRLYQGVLETNAEALIIKGLGRSIENTSEAFAKSKIDGVDWLTIQGPHSSALNQVELSKDVRARIEDDLTAGYIAIIPPKAVPIGGRTSFYWWRIDPTTGQVLGFGPDGFGQGMTEYLETALTVSHFVEYLKCLVEASKIKNHDLRWAKVTECVIEGIAAYFLHNSLMHFRYGRDLFYLSVFTIIVSKCFGYVLSSLSGEE